MNQEKIGKFICSLRKEKGMTQQELADRLGVTDRAISKWENGRGMPDYSLIDSLCKELGITINELLSGERIQKEEAQKKFEENVRNTLDYSRKRIKREKKIFRMVLGLILLVLVIFSSLFGIDLSRMRHGKPVFFSTWGFNYTPSVADLDEVKIAQAIKTYLIEEDEKEVYHDHEKSFVALKTYQVTKKRDVIYVYALILQEKYYQDQEEILNGSGSCIPYQIALKKVNDHFVVTKYQIPRDGDLYAKDLKRLFPSKVIRKIDQAYVDGTVEKLELEIQEQVELYFHK